MCTRQGDVWTYSDGEWALFARGLQEPLGLRVYKGDVYCVQRSELTRLVDKDADGKADLYETVSRGWAWTGNYHEYAFGLAVDNDGCFRLNLGLSFIKGGDRFKGKWLGVSPENTYRGWHVKITPDGKFVPVAPGLRAPNGVGRNPDGDIFTTDNQGSYVATGWLMHVLEGDFLGHPSGLQFDPRYEKELGSLTEDKLDKMRKMPAVYIPCPELGRSCSEPHWDTTGGKFGPFAGQAFIGEVVGPLILRVSLEKVQGEYQGACYEFLRGGNLGGGSNRFAFDPKDGSMWVGQTARGWGKGEGLVHITWSGEVPMEIREIKLTRTGFDIHYTRPVDRAAATKPESYNIKRYFYPHRRAYNVRKADVKTVQVTSVKLSGDGTVASLALADMTPRRVYEFKIKNVQGSKGESFGTGVAYYTLNRLLP